MFISHYFSLRSSNDVNASRPGIHTTQLTTKHRQVSPISTEEVKKFEKSTISVMEANMKSRMDSFLLKIIFLKNLMNCFWQRGAHAY